MAEAVIEPAETTPQVQVPARRTVLVSRDMGLWTVILFSLSSIGLAYSGLLPFSTLAGMWPGTSLAGMIGIGGLIILPLVFIFSAIGTIAPRYGADYIVASRVISPPLAFASSWTLVIFLAMAGGSVAASIAQNLIPVFAKTMSLVVHDNNFMDISNWAASPTGVILVGTVGVILLFLILNAPPQVTHRTLLFGAVISVIAWIVPCVIFAINTPAQFQSAWEGLMGQGSFWNHLQQARDLGMKSGFSLNTLLAAGFMLTLWLFSGSFNPIYLAGEVKNPKRNLLFGNFVALAVGVTLLAAAAYFLQHVVALEWLSAESFLYQTGADQSAMPWLPFYTTLLSPNVLVLRLIGLASLVSYLMMALTFFYVASRIMLAWGEDHLVPPFLTFIHPQLRSPSINVLFICLLATVGVIETALNTGIDDRINAVFFFVGVEFLPVLAITLLPFRKREWFQQATGFVRARIGPLPVVSIAGGLCIIYLVAMIAALVIWPGYNPLNVDTLMWFGIMFASGLAWFYGRRLLLKRQGQNIDPLLSSTPEE